MEFDDPVFSMAEEWILNVLLIEIALLLPGCDSGFGHVLAKRMDSNGYRVIAGCLFPNGDGARQLLETKNSDGAGISVVPCDVTNERSLADAADFVTKQLGGKLGRAL